MITHTDSKVNDKINSTKHPLQKEFNHYWWYERKRDNPEMDRYGYLVFRRAINLLWDIERNYHADFAKWLFWEAVKVAEEYYERMTGQYWYNNK